MFKKQIVGLAATAALFGATGLVSNASAEPYALASSSFLVQNFLIKNADGTTVLASQFDVLEAVNNTDLSSGLNGPATSTGGSSAPPLGLDLAQNSKGTNPNGENNFSISAFPPPSTFARADMQLTGNAIDFGGGTTGANASLITEVALVGSPNVGTATGNVGLNADFSFSLSTDQTLTFTFDAVVNVFTQLANTSGFTVPPDERSAQSSISWSLSIADAIGTEVFFWSPTTPCNLQATRSRLQDNPPNALSCSGSFSNTTGILDGDTTYSLNIRQTANSDATLITSVPEPASLALVGLALAGLGYSSRRKRT